MACECIDDDGALCLQLSLRGTLELRSFVVTRPTSVDWATLGLLHLLLSLLVSLPIGIDFARGIVMTLSSALATNQLLTFRLYVPHIQSLGSELAEPTKILLPVLQVSRSRSGGGLTPKAQASGVQEGHVQLLWTSRSL